MTDDEWQTITTKPAHLVAAGRTSLWRSTLLQCAACRLVQPHLPAPRFVEALDDLERAVAVPTRPDLNGNLTPSAVQDDLNAARITPTGHAAAMAVVAAYWYPRGGTITTCLNWVETAACLAAPRGRVSAMRRDIRAAMCELCREIFPNPNRERTAIATWLGGGWLQPCGTMYIVSPTAKSVAEGIAERQSYADLPILADALEETSCLDVELLDHLRHGSRHVRGCWALDLVLGRL